MSDTQTSPATTSRNWCECQHWTFDRTDVYGHHGRCATCYTNCPALGACRGSATKETSR